MVPPLASAIHQTYSAIARPQATGISMPQMPTPVTNSQVDGDDQDQEQAERNAEADPPPQRRAAAQHPRG